jgi:hypothetical protein
MDDTVNRIISEANFLFGATVGSVEDRPIRTLEETGLLQEQARLRVAAHQQN